MKRRLAVSALAGVLVVLLGTPLVAQDKPNQSPEFHEKFGPRGDGGILWLHPEVRARQADLGETGAKDALGQRTIAGTRQPPRQVAVVREVEDAP